MPRPPMAPPLPEHPGESLNSIQALQSAERRKDKDIKDGEYYKGKNKNKQNAPPPQDPAPRSDIIKTFRKHFEMVQKRQKHH